MRDDGGCGFFRCIQPAKYLQYMGLALTEVVLSAPTTNQLLSADLVVMQEMGTPNSLKMAKLLTEKNIPFIVDIDDYLHHVSPHNIGGYPAWNPSTLFLHRAMELLQRAWGATVSTAQLAREYFPYNQAIFILPNYLDKDRWDVPVAKRQDGKIRIGWCGGNAHADDLKMISKVLERIIREHKKKVVFETMGMMPAELKSVFPMQHTSTEACQSCGYEGELHHFPGESLENYSMVLASKGWDIAVAPVINNAFGNCKSNLKIMEYAALGLPIVASNVVPYREALHSGAGVFLAENYEEWYTYLTQLIEKSTLREKLAKQNKAWIEQYWIQDNAQKAFAVYSEIIGRAQKLFPK